MAKSSLNWYKGQAKNIMNALWRINQTTIANEVNASSKQVISYRMRNVYPRQIEEWLRLLELAGYEVVQKGEET